MSGGYEDDVDKGDIMCVTDPCFPMHCISPGNRTYTGTGGRDDDGYGGGSGAWGGGGGVQTSDQSFGHRDNQALLVRSRGPEASVCLTTF